MFGNKKIVIYGAGTYGAKTAKNLQAYNIAFECFCDQDSSKYNSVYENHMVKSMETIQKEYKKDTICFFLAVVKSSDAIKRDLMQKYGLCEEDFINLPNFSLQPNDYLFENKEISILNTSNEAKMLKILLGTFDIKVDYFIDVESNKSTAHVDRPILTEKDMKDKKNVHIFGCSAEIAQNNALRQLLLRLAQNPTFVITFTKQYYNPSANEFDIRSFYSDIWCKLPDEKQYSLLMSNIIFTRMDLRAEGVWSYSRFFRDGFDIMTLVYNIINFQNQMGSNHEDTNLNILEQFIHAVECAKPPVISIEAICNFDDLYDCIKNNSIDDVKMARLQDFLLKTKNSLYKTSNLNTDDIWTINVLDITKLPHLSYTHGSIAYIYQHIDELKILHDKLADDISKEQFFVYCYFRTFSKLPDIHLKRSNLLLQYIDPTIIQFSENEVIVDAGAANGDTVGKFTYYTNNSFKSIYCYEPYDEYYNALSFTYQKDKRIKCFNAGTGSENYTAFLNDDGCPTVRGAGNIPINIVSIDETVKEPVTFIKMDVEGAEMESLIGAKNQIKNHRPKLAISAYHKTDDLLDLPNYILSLNPDYKLYFRIHEKWYLSEVLIYAIH